MADCDKYDILYGSCSYVARYLLPSSYTYVYVHVYIVSCMIVFYDDDAQPSCQPHDDMSDERCAVIVIAVSMIYRVFVFTSIDSEIEIGTIY